MENELKEISYELRKKIIQLSFDNRASHVGGAMSILDILVVLYFQIINKNPQDSHWSERDRVFYSKGHACMALYTVLQKAGYFSEEELDTFTKNGSIFTSHVNHKVAGVELSTGSLGHALNVACGVALSGKIKNQKWNVYTVLSDGELNEGSNWEAIMFAPHHKLNNLTLIIDYNKIQSFGTTKEVLDLDYSSSLVEKLKAFGWDTFEIDGHNYTQIIHTFQATKHALKPRAIIANTVKGKGVDFMENNLAWHYKSPNAEELKSALNQLNIK